MKIFSVFQPGRPLRRSDLLSYALINQFATPGLGSLLAKRFVAGTGQLLLAVAGFLLFMGWFFQKMRVFYGQIEGTTLPANTGNKLGEWGLIVFAAAWLWSLVTSIQMIRSAPKDSIPPSKPLPPIL